MDETPVIARRLKEARIRARISQMALGVAAGIDEFSASPRVNQYERGKHTPDFLILEKFAAVLGVPTEYFYARDEHMAEMLMAFNRLSWQHKKEVIAFANELMQEREGADSK